MARLICVEVFPLIFIFGTETALEALVSSLIWVGGKLAIHSVNFIHCIGYSEPYHLVQIRNDWHFLSD